MRNDLTQAFIDAKNANPRAPRQLLAFYFASGTRYLSDQNIVVGGVPYEGLVEDWGQLTDAGNPREDLVSGLTQASITLFNGGPSPFSDHFLEQPPEGVWVSLLQWFEGLDVTDAASMGFFVVRDPIEWDEASRLLNLDLVSVGIGADQVLGATVSSDDWPDAKPADIGQPVNLVIGSPGAIKTLCVKTPPQTKLNGGVIAGSTTIKVVDDLDDLGFPASGQAQIGEEVISFGSRTATKLYVSGRAANDTEADAHSDGSALILLISDHTYLVGEGVTGITEVQVAGAAAPAEIYTVDTASALARIVFTEKPYSEQHATSVETEEVHFDQVSVNNNSYQGYWAFDDDERTSSAGISKNYPVLAVEQVDAHSDDGQVTAAYLSITHFCTAYYTSDYVEVWVEGIGVVGTLERPGEDDQLLLEAEIDLTHTHDHSTDGYHGHDSDDPSISTEDDGHIHDLSESVLETIYAGGNAKIGEWLVWEYGNFDGYYSDMVYPSFDSENWDSSATAVLTITTVFYGSPGALKLYIGSTPHVLERAGTYEFPITLNGYEPEIQWKLGSREDGGFDHLSKLMVAAAKITLSVDGFADKNTTGVDAYVSTPGTVSGTGTTSSGSGIKDANDVVEYSDSVVLEWATQESPARTITSVFDLSDHLDDDLTWDWFTGREVQLRYVGTAEAVKILIPHIVFEVEFRRRERVFSDDVTATVTGLSDNRPDQVARYLINKVGFSDAFINTTAWTAAGDKFTSLGYGFDGVIEGSLTFKDALRAICLQSRSRLVWAGDGIKMIVREKQEDWDIARTITPDRCQLRSIKASRGSTCDIVNFIQLMYGRDWASTDSSTTAYSNDITIQDDESKGMYGKCEDVDRWLFHLVRNDEMAGDLASFYVDQLKQPSTFYEFILYLQDFDLQQGDCVSLTSSGFHQLDAVPMEIRAIDRLFGSGKSRSINQLRVLAENLRYVLQKIELEDSIGVWDSLSILAAMLGDLAEVISVADELVPDIGTGISKTITVADIFEIIWVMNETLETTVSVGDELAGYLDIELTDSVQLTDNITSFEGAGWGTTPWGSTGWGGNVSHFSDQADTLRIVDIVYGLLEIAVGDSVQITDSITYSTGWSSPRGPGWGTTPWGR